MGKVINFNLDESLYYLKPSPNVMVMNGVSSQELNRVKAQVTLLGMKTGILRYNLCKACLNLLFLVLAFLSYYLILPVYINNGKAYSLFCLSTAIFFALIGICWHFTIPCVIKYKWKKDMFNKLEKYVYNNQTEIYRDFTSKGWELEIRPNNFKVTVCRLKLDDSIPIMPLQQLGGITFNMNNIGEFAIEPGNNHETSLQNLVLGANNKVQLLGGPGWHSTAYDSDSSSYESVVTSDDFVELV